MAAPLNCTFVGQTCVCFDDRCDSTNDTLTKDDDHEIKDIKATVGQVLKVSSPVRAAKVSPQTLNPSVSLSCSIPSQRSLHLSKDLKH